MPRFRLVSTQANIVDAALTLLFGIEFLVKAMHVPFLCAVSTTVLELSIAAHPVLGWAWNSNPRLFSRTTPSRRIPEDLLARCDRGGCFASDAERIESWTLRAHLVEEAFKVLWNLRRNGIGADAWHEGAHTLHLSPRVIAALLLPFNEINQGMDPSLLGLAPFVGASRRFVDADVDVLVESAALLLDLVQHSEQARSMLQQPMDQMDPSRPATDILVSFAAQTQLPPAWRAALAKG